MGGLETFSLLQLPTLHLVTPHLVTLHLVTNRSVVMESDLTAIRQQLKRYFTLNGYDLEADYAESILMHNNTFRGIAFYCGKLRAEFVCEDPMVRVLDEFGEECFVCFAHRMESGSTDRRAA